MSKIIGAKLGAKGEYKGHSYQNVALTVAEENKADGKYYLEAFGYGDVVTQKVKAEIVAYFMQENGIEKLSELNGLDVDFYFDKYDKVVQMFLV